MADAGTQNMSSGVQTPSLAPSGPQAVLRDHSDPTQAYKSPTAEPGEERGGSVGILRGIGRGWAGLPLPPGATTQ